MPAIVFLALLFAGCMSAHHEAASTTKVIQFSNDPDIWSAASSIKTPDAPTFAYHWTNSEKAKSNPKEYIRQIIGAARHQNEAGEGLGGPGNGLYMAPDPIATQAFGKYLVVVPIKPSKTFVRINLAKQQEASDIVKSAVPGIVYSYAALLTGSDGKVLHYAAVVRNEDLIDMNGLKVFGPKSTTCDTQSFQRLSFNPNDSYDALLHAAVDGSDFALCSRLTFELFFGAKPTYRFPLESDRGLVMYASAAYARSLYRAAGADVDAIDWAAFSCQTQQNCMGAMNTALTAGIAGETVENANDNFTDAEFLTVAKSLNFVDADVSASSKTEIAAQIVFQLRRDHPDFLEKLTSRVSLFQTLMSRSQQQGMNLWHP